VRVAGACEAGWDSGCCVDGLGVRGREGDVLKGSVRGDGSVAMIVRPSI
jgi:hypothetical protein